MKALIEDPIEADRRYDRLQGSRSGRVVSTDLARFLDLRYAAAPAGQPRDLAPGWDLAWRYAQDRFARELRNRGEREIVRFMAGGWAAGKTHALKDMNQADLAWDGTLSDAVWARKMINLALQHDWKVEVAHVHRDVELALYGAIERAADEGRSVPLADLPGIHRSVQRSIARLFDRYFDHPGVSFLLFHNVGTEKVKSPPLPIAIADLEPEGALHYTLTHEQYFSEAAKRFAIAASC